MSTTAHGTNVTSRHDNIEIDNRTPTFDQHIETINSEDRDLNTYPNPNSYTIPLSTTYRRVLEVELLSAEIPKSQYVIEERDPQIKNKGNNQFRFGEGYIIDDGSIFGICNDRLMIREYSPPGTCDPHCVDHKVLFPRTLTRLESVELLSHHSNDGNHHSQEECTRILVTTCDTHRLSCNLTPVVYIIDHCPDENDNSSENDDHDDNDDEEPQLELNGCYHVESIVNTCQFVAFKKERCVIDVHAHQSEGLESSDDGDSHHHFQGWLHVPRVSSPEALAQLVEDYTNNQACPPLINSYSVCFDAQRGRFFITRGYGLIHFDLLAGSDERSILKTMGFVNVDYLYGQWARQNHQQTQLPSDVLFDPMLRPDVGSRSVGESALVAIKEGNYDPVTLSKAITNHMHLPFIIPDKNDLLIFQIRGRAIPIRIPPGLYTPDLLIQAIATFMEDADGKADYRGCYDVCDGIYSLENLCQEEFGLLFSRSTIGEVIGFRKVDLTGSSYYESMWSIMYPVMNGRYTNQLYQVSPEFTTSKFRFLKKGAYQTRVVAVEPVAEKKLRLFTHTKEKGGGSHGLQAGDIVQLEGPCPIGGSPAEGVMNTVPAWNEWHVVDKVIDAYTFELALKYISGDPAAGSNIVIHAYEPFFLHFRGVKDNISEVVGIKRSLSGCVEYLADCQWEFLRPCEIFLLVRQTCQGDWGRISKVSDSGPQSKYTYKVMQSFVRIPRRCQFGVTPITSFIRRKRFLFNTMDFSEFCIEFTDSDGDPINFHGKEHCLSFRFFTET